MTKFNLFLLTSSIFIFISCLESGNDESNESFETTSNEEISVDLENDSELETAIIEDLENEQFSSKLNEVKGLLIDVRTAEEFNEGHIEGAINLGYNSGAFEAYVDSLNPTEPVFVYCHAGGRSGKARDILKDRNFSEVYNLKNGYGKWDK